MEGSSSTLLTNDDFYLEANLPHYHLLACPNCHVDTSFILRHAKCPYIAEFVCENHSCTHWSKKWFKCRLCTHKNKSFTKASAHLRNTLIHNQRLAAFKLLKSSEYIEREERFTTPILDIELSSGIDHSNLFAAFAVAIADRRSITGESQVQEFDSTSHDDFSLSFDNADDDDDQSDEMSVDVVSEESISPPATVTEWRRQLIANSQNLAWGNDLSPYFPIEEEETPINGHIRRPWNAQYYEYNLHYPGGGPRLLVAQAVVGNAAAEVIRKVHPKNALWCVLLSKISNKLSLIEQEILVGLMDHMRRPTPRDFLPLPVPNKHCELRRNFISGRNSIPELLPRPIPIQILEGGFVYVSIREILQYHLANGRSLDPLLDLEYSELSRVRALHGSSRRGKELLSLTVQGNQVVRSSGEPVKIPLSKLPTEVLLWSDGFDPNNRKDNRGSAHIVFVSIGTPQDDYHGGRNTYPVSIGPANGDLTIISKRIAEELTEMFKDEPDMNVYFDATSKKELEILARVYCLLQDRPERCHWLCLAHGNGRYSGRFGWSADLSQKQVLAFLPSCKECNDFRMKNKVRTCKSCADWCMSRVHFKVPEDFPTVFTKRCDMEDADGSEVADVNPKPDDETTRSPPLDPRVEGTHLPCSQLTVEKLKLACIDCFDMVRLGKWQKKQGRAYLDTHGIAPDYCKQICDTAERIKNSGNQEPMPELPATWSIPGVDICHHIDVPMHLCFLGITKALFFELIRDWLKSKKKSTSFTEKSKPLLVKIRKLSLSWCQIECTFGGFVSENWVAYCRICKYICGLFPNLDIKDVEYEDPPGVPLSQYKFQQKKAWLVARKINGINYSSKKQQVDEAFSKYLSLPVGTQLPPIVKPTVSSASLDVVHHMVISWNVCMSRIMSLDRNPREDQVNDTERHIKLFLTSVHEFDKSRVEAEEKKRRKRRKEQNKGGNSSDNQRMKKEAPPVPPVWRRKPNFLGLLNIPETIRLMGPIRVLTELDLKGEASIKHVKSKIKQGLNGNWAYNAMLGYYRERSYQYVLKDCLVDIDEMGCDESSPEPMMEVTNKIVGSLRVEQSLEEEGEDEDSQTDEDSSEDEDKGISPATNKRYKKYQTFIKVADAAESLGGDAPVSGMVANGRFYLVIKNKEGHSVLEIRPRKWNEEVCGANYHTWETVGVMSNTKPVNKIVLESQESFLLLPANPKDTETRAGNSFYLISSEWRELSKSKYAEGRFVLQLPTIPGASY